jgi:hypothetical protein
VPNRKCLKSKNLRDVNMWRPSRCPLPVTRKRVSDSCFNSFCALVFSFHFFFTSQKKFVRWDIAQKMR